MFFVMGMKTIILEWEAIQCTVYEVYNWNTVTVTAPLLVALKGMS